MQRYTVSQFDGDTFVVVDQDEQREYCICGNYDDSTDAKERAEKMANLLNASEANTHQTKHV
jgi:hypothetical protein